MFYSVQAPSRYLVAGDQRGVSRRRASAKSIRVPWRFGHMLSRHELWPAASPRSSAHIPRFPRVSRAALCAGRAPHIAASMSAQKAIGHCRPRRTRAEDSVLHAFGGDEPEWLRHGLVPRSERAASGIPWPHAHSLVSALVNSIRSGPRESISLVGLAVNRPPDERLAPVARSAEVNKIH